MSKHAERRTLRTFALWLAVLISFLPYAKAAPKVVWQIGTFNDSSSEFNLGKPGPPFFGDRYPKELLYVVGKSTPEADWPARQLGSAIFQPGGHPRPYTIQFDLDEIPQGVYTLKVALLLESSCVGQLQVEVNGHVGFYYQHPKLSYTGGDREMVVSPLSSTDTILVDLPAKFFQKGANKLVLTAVDEPSEAVGEAHSMLVYDALELDHDSARKFPADEMIAEVVPTVFYVRHEGGLAEMVDVFVRHNATVQHGQISLTVAGQTFSEEMP
ncbi:MAG: polysaccharide lyase family protein, partial [Terriglobia bacterium]